MHNKDYTMYSEQYTNVFTSYFGDFLKFYSNIVYPWFCEQILKKN